MPAPSLPCHPTTPTHPLTPPYAPAAGFRGRIITSRKALWKGGPFKPLTEGLRGAVGRSGGQITVRHRDGGHKRSYRRVDFVRASGTPPATVQRVEYDPNRSARIALCRLAGAAEEGQPLRRQYAYYLAPQGVAPGDVLHTGEGAPIKPGSALPLSAIPIGSAIHNVELLPGKGGQLARAAGTSATLVKKGERGWGAGG